MYLKNILFIFLLGFIRLNAIPSAPIWEELQPYFLPDNHPVKFKLDQLFKKKRIIQSEKTFEKTGFVIQSKRKNPTNILVGKHPLFKDYLFKVYLDNQLDIVEWDNWLKRIKGAQAIKNCIQKYGFSHFKVPQKWIYPLPLEPSLPKHPRYQRKNFILIVEDMNVLDPQENLKAFKEKITPQILDELYLILSEEGLIDSVYPDNIPFTQDGFIAFIDTEHYNLSPVPYEKISPFLSKKMQKYWQFLSKQENE